MHNTEPTPGETWRQLQKFYYENTKLNMVRQLYLLNYTNIFLIS